MANIFESLGKPDYLFDSHAHLNAAVFDKDRDMIVDDCKKAGVSQIWDMAVDPVSIKTSLKISSKFKIVKSFIGIDPDVFIPGSNLFTGLDASDEWFGKNRDMIETLLSNPSDEIIGIGETGIDKYWLLNVPEDQQVVSLELQEKLFRMHLEIADQFSLPLSIHSRNAEEMCAEILSEYNVTGIFHSYTGDYKTAKKIIEMGFGLGVNGIVTFPNSQMIKDLYKKFIGNKKFTEPKQFYENGIFFETDSPYLSPDGKRGLRNNPSNINDIFEYMCSLSE